MASRLSVSLTVPGPDDSGFGLSQSSTSPVGAGARAVSPSPRPPELPASSTSSSSVSQNIRVVARFRPINSAEHREEKNDEKGAEDDFRIRRQEKSVYFPMPRGESARQFTFDDVIWTNDGQEEAFEILALPLVEKVIAGYNCTIFAYGQTGSGKTYTMFGPPNLNNVVEMGIIPRCSTFLFDSLVKDSNVLKFHFTLSVVEIYMEEMRDLLNPESKERLKIMMGNGDVFVRGLVEQPCTNVEEMLRVILRAQSNRRVTTTQVFSHQSSRSHCVVMITVTQRMLDDTVKISKLNFGDLAGSEVAKRTRAQGQTLKEAGKIHLGLHALEKVMTALLKNATHIPYMESKLTRLLKDSLGGNSLTTLLVACSPHVSSRSETRSTLEFAKRAKSIKNKAKINKRLTSKQLEARVRQLEEQVARLQEENGRLRRMRSPSKRLLIMSPRSVDLSEDEMDVKTDGHESDVNEEDLQDGENNEEMINLMNELNDVRGQLDATKNEYESKIREFDVSFADKESEVSEMMEKNLVFERENELLKTRLHEQSEMLLKQQQQIVELMKQAHPASPTSGLNHDHHMRERERPEPIQMIQPDLNLIGPNGENLWDVLLEIRASTHRTENILDGYVMDKLENIESVTTSTRQDLDDQTSSMHTSPFLDSLEYQGTPFQLNHEKRLSEFHDLISQMRQYLDEPRQNHEENNKSRNSRTLTPPMLSSSYLSIEEDQEMPEPSSSRQLTIKYSPMTDTHAIIPFIVTNNDFLDFKDRIGMLIDVLDSSFYWYFARVIHVDTNHGIKIHYDGFDDKWDEWIGLNEMCRVTERNTHADGGKDSNGVHVFEATSFYRTVDGRNSVRKVLQSLRRSSEETLDLSRATMMLQIEVIMAGNMLRKTSRNAWVQRYFEMRSDNYIYYYNNDMDRRKERKIDLNQVSVMRRTRDGNIENGFELVEVGGKVWTFNAESRQTLCDWCSCIHAVRKNVLGNEGLVRETPARGTAKRSSKISIGFSKWKNRFG